MTVRKIDVSRYLGYAKPSVTRGISLLEKRKLVNVDGSGNLKLTEEGERIAGQVYERHTTLASMFMSLGVDEKTAVEDACRIEHFISETTFSAIKEHFGKYR